MANATVTVPIEFVAQFEKAVKDLNSFTKHVETQTGLMESLFSGLGVAIGAIGAYLTVGKIIDGISAITHEAAQAQVAVNSMSLAMKLAGDYSERNAQAFQALAEQLAKTSKFDDDVILSQVRLAKQFGLTNQEAAKLISAAVDLAGATGSDLNTAVYNLGQTFDGTVGRVGQSIPALQHFTAEQLKAGAAVDYVAKHMHGFAQGELNTFDGAIIQVGKSFKDLEKALGAPIVQSKNLIEAFKLVGGFLEKLAEMAKHNKQAIANLVTEAVLLAVEAFGLLAQSLDTTIRYFDKFMGYVKTFGNYVAAVAQFQIGDYSGAVDSLKASWGNLTETMNMDMKGPTVFAEMSAQAKDLAEKIKELIARQDKFNESLKKTGKGFGDETPTANRIESFQQKFSKGIMDVLAGLPADILGGSKGAVAFLGSIGSLVGESLLGPAGKALGPLLQELSKGPENAKKMVTQFMDAIPELIENIVKAIPVVIEVMANKAPEVINRLAEDAPAIIEKLIEDAPRIITAVIASYPKVLAAQIRGAVLVTSKLLEGAGRFVGRILQGAVHFVGRILQGAGEFIKKLISGIGHAFGGGGGGGGWLGAAEGSVLGAVAGGSVGSVVGTVTGGGDPRNWFKQARGGDSFARANNARSSGGGPSHLAVHVQIGRSQFAKALVDVKRLGYRLEPI